MSEAGRAALGQAPMPKLSAAQLRILLYMARTGANLVRGDWGTAWTHDEYRWPVPGSTVRFLTDARFIDRDAGSNEHELLKLSAAGMTALEAMLKRLAARPEAIQ